ncbi:MAG: SH3 domain-containing protein [Anaerolineae bacterium]|nr:SH3 domain-containing protein [Anaerolineae bacterium]
MLIVLVVLAILLPMSSILAQGEGSSPDVLEYLVTAASANLRGGPGTTYPVVGTVMQGDSLLIYDETPETAGWLRIYRPDEEDAFIADFLVERAPMHYYPPDQEPIAVVSGRGSTISEVLEIPRGAYRIDASVQDNAFILHSIVVEGDCDDETVFNELNFDVRSLEMSGLFISSGCTIIFETDNVDGTWEFALRDIIDADVLLETMVAIEDGTTITGRGRALTMPTLLPEGIWTLTATVEDNFFILRPQVLTGDCDGFSVFNEGNVDTNSLEVSTVYRSESDDGDGCIIFWESDNVDGAWEIQFTQIR